MEFGSWNQLIDFLREHDISILDVIEYDSYREPYFHVVVKFTDEAMNKIMEDTKNG